MSFPFPLLHALAHTYLYSASVDSASMKLVIDLNVMRVHVNHTASQTHGPASPQTSHPLPSFTLKQTHLEAQKGWAGTRGDKLEQPLLVLLTEV